MGRLFGTDGVRGVANKDLTPELAFNLGKAGAFVLKKENKRPVIVIGKDTRVSGDMLESALIAGILAVGGNVIRAGVIPTPAVAYLTRYYKADAGIVISASHNSFEYNGIKFFNREGYKLDDRLEEKIEDIIISSVDVNSHVTGDEIGKCLDAAEKSQALYIEHLLSAADYLLDDRTLVIDCANGATYDIAEKVYSRLGARVITTADEPDGMNINDRCGSTHPERLSGEVVRQGADIGLAFDGDGDRLIAVDSRGRVLDGDRTIAICAKMLKEQGRLKGNKVTVTVMSNIGLHKAMNEAGIEVDVTGVGDRYVLEKMLETGCVIGGEQSGHIIFSEYTTTGDGIISSLQLMKTAFFGEKNLTQMYDEIEIYPQVIVNARVREDLKRKYMQDEEIARRMDEVNEELKDTGRLLIRPSGTEPLVRVMIEGRDTRHIQVLAEELAALIEKKFDMED